MFQAISMYLMFLLLTLWIPSRWLQRIVGIGLPVDIGLQVLLQVLFGGDAAGRASLILCGVMLSVTMILYKRVFGYQKLTFKGWKHISHN